ncbi:MAG: hypothetical protein IPM69_01265 [Ignavibacteria bacterium]|nr:hypothetical protein [Ignavibacteria bacterium]
MKPPIIIMILMFVVLFNKTDVVGQGFGSITLDTSKPSIPISPYVHGGFIEQIYDAVNGIYGFGAQELYNRGFDIGTAKDKISKGWFDISTTTSGSLIIDTLGYNQRGRFSQHIANYDGKGRIGVAQAVYVERNVPMELYVYAKCHGLPTPLTIALYTTDSSSVVFDTVIGMVDSEWKKYTFQFPASLGFPKAILFIGLDSVGSLEIDEASFMSTDNFHGIRRAHFELYKMWRPTILRYPGGGVVDLAPGYWEHAIGEIDQRTSPNLDWVGDYNRFDVGTDEFMAFCEAVGADPQLTVSFGSGTPKDAANFVEYCNSPIGKRYSNLRSNHGYKKPFNVKYWEVGNEQYGPWEFGHTTAVNYANRYLEFAKEMRAIDTSIKLLINGDTWGFNWNDTIIRIASKEIDLLSVHWLAINRDTLNNRDNIHKSMMSNISFGRDWNTLLHHKAVESGLSKDIPLALTECVQIYDDPHNYMIPIGGSLESGLWTSMTLNMIIKLADIVKLVNKTMFLGSIRAGIHSLSGERVFFAGPTLYAQILMRNWMRDSMQPVIVTSTHYTFEGRDNIAWLDAAVTESNDTMAVSVVNSHSTDSISVKLQLPVKRGSICEAVVLNGTSDTTYNTPENPNAVSPVYYNVVIDSVMVFPAHSHTIFRFPVFHAAPSVDTVIIKDNIQLVTSKNNPFFTVMLSPRSVHQGELTIYDLEGKVVESKKLDIPLHSSFYKFELQNPSIGMYLCSIKFGDITSRYNLLVTP